MATNSSATPAPTLTLQTRFPTSWSLADLQRYLSDIPLERILLVLPPGYATEEDVVRLDAQEDRLCELQDGILVEKPMGWYESMLALLIATEINAYLRLHVVGKLWGADGSLKFLPGTVKIPDVSFISWARWPKEKLPRRPIPALVPDLVVEVLSDTDTKGEMENKLVKYFEAGVRLVWDVDPETRTARSFISPATSRISIQTERFSGPMCFPIFSYRSPGCSARSIAPARIGHESRFPELPRPVASQSA